MVSFVSFVFFFLENTCTVTYLISWDVICGRKKEEAEEMARERGEGVKEDEGGGEVILKREGYGRGP